MAQAGGPDGSKAEAAVAAIEAAMWGSPSPGGQGNRIWPSGGLAKQGRTGF